MILPSFDIRMSITKSVIMMAVQPVIIETEICVEPILVVYNHTKDFPDMYVVRLFLLEPNGLYPTEWSFKRSTLTMARSVIPLNFVRHDPSPTDDPVIMEVWRRHV